MFEQIQPAPSDPILGLTEAFKADPAPDKINLGVGVYKDDAGATPVLSAVKKAEARLLESESSKSYFPIPGSPGYIRGVQEVLFGPEHAGVAAGTVRTAHTPGGTGGLRVGAEFLKRFRPDAAVWVSSPTWANHKGVFGAAGFPVREYPYYDPETHALREEECLEALAAVPAGDIVVLHVCCHNPTGVDPEPEQWVRLAEVAERAGWLPFFDFAYQGFGESVEADRKPLDLFSGRGLEFAVAASCSKNFGLYNERVGSFTLAATTRQAAEAAFSHVKTTIRTLYSNPPGHGGAIVETILQDPELRREWLGELRAMRERIQSVRAAFVERLGDSGVRRDVSFIRRQKGMFSFSGLAPDQVRRLREEYGIYIVDSGRVNVAGVTSTNIDRLCEAMAEVTGS